MSTVKIVGWFFLTGIIILLVVLFTGTCNTGVKMIDNAQQTVYDQYKPSELLHKYEWFKDASATLDADIATISMYQTRFKTIYSSYGADSLKRTKWSRDDREQWNVWQSEITGIKASYNTLASEYNSQMAKFNWRFCNRGTLPAGAENPLPKEYKPYITE